MKRLFALSVLASAGCIHGEVVRVIDGVEVRGPFISDVAYASHARGAELEARGDYAGALEAYELSASHDPDNVEAWTRIGAMRCRLKQADGVEQAFGEAEDLDGDYEPLWRARALCWEARGRIEEAAAAAARAVTLDPERDETVLIHARLLARRGKLADALRWLRALGLRSPASVEAWEALADTARRAGDRVWYHHALAHAESLRMRFGQRPAPKKGSLRWSAVDAALAARELNVARRRLRQARIDPGLLAARAISMGRPDVALADAELRLGAEPEDSDARVALALAADLLGQRERAAEVMRELPANATPLGSVARLLLVELVMRQGGGDAIAGWPPEDRSADGAEADLLERLEARIGLRRDASQKEQEQVQKAVPEKARP
jgi:tetratricopeptide (TPR) repeat protein